MDHSLQRSLGLTGLIAIVMGAIIGVGIFFTPARVVDITGDGNLALIAWAIGGAIAATGALTFAELGGLIPKTGGQYIVLRESFGQLAGFLYSWALLTVIQSGAIAIIAIICIEYLASFADRTLSPAWITALAMGLVAALTLLNILGVRAGAGVAMVTSAAKALTLLAIALLGVFAAGEETVLAAAAGGALPKGDGRYSLLLPAIVPVLFSFGGWQQGLYLGGEVKHPERVLPLGIIIGVGAVVGLYLLVNFGFLQLLGVRGMVGASALASDAVATVLPGAGAKLTALAVAISALGVASVCTMTAPRMYKAMADDGAFFAAFGRVHPRFHTPFIALATQGFVTLVWVLAGKGRIDALLNGVVCIDWVFFALTGFALFRLRKLRPGPRPFRVPFYPLTPGLFTLAALFVILATLLDEQLRVASVTALAVLAAGVVAWGLFRRSVAE